MVSLRLAIVMLISRRVRFDPRPLETPRSPPAMYLTVLELF